jgi:hypothetical protein
MTCPFKDLTLDEAQEYLRQDFSKTVKRTIYLYLNTNIKQEIGDGYFEPVLLFFCWCDYLGALYTGEPERGKSTKRSKVFIRDILGKINKRYKDANKDLMNLYRHPLVHIYQPKNFFIARCQTDNHLKMINEQLHISIEQLLNDMLEGIKLFAEGLDPDNNKSKGSLYAFNKATKIICIKTHKISRGN